MKPMPLILVSVALSTAAAGLLVAVLGTTGAPESSVSAAASLPSSEVEALRRELADQRELVSELSRKLEQSAMTLPAVAPSRVPAEDVEAVVRRLLAEGQSAAQAVAGKAEGAPADAASASASFSVKGAAAEIADMLNNRATYEELESYWEGLRAKGIAAADVVAAFESFAAEHPGDPQAQVMLGNAYIQRLEEAKNSSEMGEWAVKADGAYSAALELDETNWEARFSKAVSLSFWPPIFGKQAEAIGHFETLLDQQRQVAAKPAHAQTYLLLGNLYQQQGDADKAKALWQEGYDLFPDDDDLGSKVGTGGN